MKNELEQKAFELGKQAFKNEKKCIPIHDPELMKLAKENPNESMMPLFEAWSEGWHQENLNQS